MKVVLIAPPIMDRVDGELRPISMDAERECPPYGIYLLASCVKKAGHEVVLADLIARGSNDIRPFSDEIGGADLIGIGATSMSWPTAVDVIRQIRTLRADVPIVLGAIHPTMFDRYVLQNYPVQYVIRGEGEVALLRLCEALEGRSGLSEVPNLSWVDPSGTLVRNPVASKIRSEEMPDFPMPDYSTLPEQVYKGLAIESSRGCAFDCSFCSTSYRKTYRRLDPEAFVDRLEQVLPHTGRTRYGTIHIIDDEFSLNPKRAIGIAQLIRKRGLEPWLVYDSRAPDLLFDGYVENIAEFTCQFLVGCECGYDEGLIRIGKGTTCDLLERAAAKLALFGIADRADFSFILGLPWETVEEVRKTIRFAMHLHGTYGVRVLLQWYCQIPGSRLWDKDRRDEIVNESMYNDYGFFRDQYLFRSGVKLTPSEIYEIGDMVAQLQFLTAIHSPGRRMIEFTFPRAIYDYYPRDVVTGEAGGLANLREVARPPVRVGIPERHFVGSR